jgi:hypothetical protein
VVGLSLAIEAGATACTRVLWNDNSVAVLASRSMDWWGSSQSRLHVMPRGLKKSGASFGKDKIVTENPARWTSKYGSVVVGNSINRYRSKHLLALMYGSRALLVLWYLAMPKSEWVFYVFAVGLEFNCLVLSSNHYHWDSTN